MDSSLEKFGNAYASIPGPEIPLEVQEGNPLFFAYEAHRRRIDVLGKIAVNEPSFRAAGAVQALSYYAARGDVYASQFLRQAAESNPGAVTRVVRNREAREREATLFALARIGTPPESVMPILYEIAGDPSDPLSQLALEAWGALRSEGEEPARDQSEVLSRQDIHEAATKKSRRRRSLLRAVLIWTSKQSWELRFPAQTSTYAPMSTATNELLPPVFQIESADDGDFLLTVEAGAEFSGGHVQILGENDQEQEYTVADMLLDDQGRGKIPLPSESDRSLRVVLLPG